MYLIGIITAIIEAIKKPLSLWDRGLIGVVRRTND
jgi:hypothetical protein